MAQGDIHLHNYQDDLDTNANAVDPFVQQQDDTLMEDTGKSASELREELGRVALDEHDTSGNPEDEDMREALEDNDQEFGENK
jgi:hypothetical protein